MKFSKKVFALFVALILAFSFSVTSFAACAHDYTVTFIGSNTYDCSADGCIQYGTFIAECSKCGHKETSIGTVDANHVLELVSATCDGTTQTWTYRCRDTGYIVRDYIICRDKNHSDGCGVDYMGGPLEENDIM